MTDIVDVLGDLGDTIVVGPLVFETLGMNAGFYRTYINETWFLNLELTALQDDHGNVTWLCSVDHCAPFRSETPRSSVYMALSKMFDGMKKRASFVQDIINQIDGDPA